jgi:hypothetical protein
VLLDRADVDLAERLHPLAHLLEVADPLLARPRRPLGVRARQTDRLGRLGLALGGALPGLRARLLTGRLGHGHHGLARRRRRPARQLDLPAIAHSLLHLLEAQPALTHLELGGLHPLAAREALRAEMPQLLLAATHVGGAALEGVARAVGRLAGGVLLAQLLHQPAPRLLAGRRELGPPRLHLLDLPLAPSDPRLRLAGGLERACAHAGDPVALLRAPGVLDPALGEGRLATLQLPAGLPDARRQRVERALRLGPLRAQRFEPPPERLALRRQRLALGDQLRALGGAAVVRLEGGLQALAGALEVLLVVRHGERRGVVAVAEVVELVGRLGQLRLGAGVRGHPRRDLGLERADLPLEVAHLARPREHAAAVLAATGQDALRREQVSGRRHERRRERAAAVDLPDLAEVRHQVRAPEQGPRHRLVAGLRVHALDQRRAERDEAARARRLVAGVEDEHRAPRARLPDPRQRGERALEPARDQRLRALAQHRLHRALRLGLGLEDVAHQPAQAVRRPHALPLLHEVARATAEVLGALQHLAQGGQPRGPHGGALARLAQALGRRAQLRGRALVAQGGLAQRVHQAIALGEQVVQALLQPALLLVGAARLALLDLDGLVGAAQAPGDLVDPVPERGDAGPRRGRSP